MKKNYLVLLLMFNFYLCYSQSTTTTHTGTVLATDYLGWDNTNGIELQIRHDNVGIPNADIEFHTRAIQRMTILGTNANFNDGFIGMALGAPRLNLEVNNNIGLIPNRFDHSYRIDSVPMLRTWPFDPTNNQWRNIFVGANAGLNNNNTGLDLTFVGFESGLNNTTGSSSVFVGARAGVLAPYFSDRLVRMV